MYFHMNCLQVNSTSMANQLYPSYCSYLSRDWLEFSQDSYLVRAGGLIHPTCVLVVLLGLGLLGHAVPLVHGCHIVHQGNGLHRLVHSATDRFPHLSGGWCPGGRLVMWRLGKEGVDKKSKQCYYNSNIKECRTS